MGSAELVYLVMPFIVAFALGFGFWLVFRQRALFRREQAARTRSESVTPPARPAVARPWWANPWLWLSVSAAFLVLGLFVSPKLLGGVFLFIPFLWVWMPRRPRRPPDPSTNGHRGDGDRPG
jgi:hypothetical protein